MPTRSATLAAELEAETEAPIGRKRAKREARKVLPQHTPWQTRILSALQWSKPVYAGLDADEDPHRAKQLQKRRAKNKVARASRRVNRTH